MAATNSPYTDLDRKRANVLLQKLNELQEELSRQEACGFDCSEGRAAREDLYNQILRWKSTYFPGLP